MTKAGLARRVELLARTPLFSNLTAKELRDVAPRFEERSYRKGEIVCEAGSEGDTFSVVASGELEVWSGDDPPRCLNRLGTGEVVGEMALLFEGRRTATVKASRPATLLELDRASFNRFFAGNPKVLHYFASVLSQRLAAATRGEAAPRRSTVIGVSGAAGLRGKSLVARCLAALLRDFGETGVLLVEQRPRAAAGRREPRLGLAELETAPADRLKSLIGIDACGVARLGIRLEGPVERPEQALGALVARAGETFPYVVLDLGRRPAALARGVREVADVSVEIVEQVDPDAREPDGPIRVHRVLNLFNRASLPIPVNRCEPYVIPEDPDLPAEPAAQAAYVRDHPRAAIAPPLHRLARKILGTSVGLAVGGGAAFGIAHVGVLRVLEANGVPVDLVAGTSFGSIVAIGYAAGLHPEEMVEIARRIGTRTKTLSALDFTLGQPGLLAGRRLVNIFSPLFGPVKRFDQLHYPCRAVATDVETGESVPIGTGRVDQAFRASCSVPLLWIPVRRGESVLVDGGMVNPVPVDVVHDMGADVCIAVNVVPPLRRGVTNAITRAWSRINRLNPLRYVGGDRELPNMLDIFMNTIQMLQHELGNFKAITADVRIVPELSDFTWVEFYKPLELIERGAEAAERALPEITRVLAERRAGARV